MGLDKETFQPVDLYQIYDDTGLIEHQIDCNSIPNIKPGVKLPKSDQNWKLAHEFFAASMPISNVGVSDLNTAISSMNSNTYNYFFLNVDSSDNSGSSDSIHLIAKYKDHPTDMLKDIKKS